ncbi:primosomal protein N' [Rickettsiales bacterium (ex Bugula neritina AB1)]|nr:primosomal protein N' [Rickettsiales bacterium (ex Bugula neritina AB1)]
MIYKILVENHNIYEYVSSNLIEKLSIVKVPVKNKIYFGLIIDIIDNNTNVEYIRKEIISITKFKLFSNNLNFIQQFHYLNIIKIGVSLKYLLYKIPKKPLKLKSINNNFILLNELTLSQKNVYESIKNYYNTHKKILLFGLTGAGKTEIYLKLIEDNLKSNKQVLFMMPEIGIISSLEIKLEKIGILPIRWFSGVKTSSGWQRVHDGEAVLVIGARSSVFLPFKKLGIIIIDEEHDSSYKEVGGYDGREMSKLLGSIFNIPVVMGSATPSSSSFYECQNDNYKLLSLTERFLSRSLPEIDMISHKNKNNIIFHEKILQNIKITLSKKQQVLIFLNKRGFGTISMCFICKHLQKCLHCDSNLIFHRLKCKLICHLCGKEYINNCLSCKKNGGIIVYGYGVERVSEYIKKIFPNENVGIFSSDFCNSSKKIKEFIQDVENNKYSIIIGTQLVAKGHNFLNIGLVAILNNNFLGFDPGSLEKLLQTIIQVSGRCGRGSIKGKVMIQIDNDFKTKIEESRYLYFLEKILNNRKKNNLPPFSNLILITHEDKNPIKASNFIKNVYEEIIKFSLDMKVFPPTNNQISKIKDKYRFFILINTKKIPYKHFMLIKEKFYNIKIDINPQDFF